MWKLRVHSSSDLVGTSVAALPPARLWVALLTQACSDWILNCLTVPVRLLLPVDLTSSSAS